MTMRNTSLFLACTLLTVFAFVLQASAQDPEIFPEVPDGPIIIAPGPDEEALLEVWNSFHGEVVNSHDADAVASFFAEDGVFDYVPAPPPAEGREIISGFFEAVYQAFPDWQCCPDGPRRNLISGNVIATECSTIGTHGGDWAGVPATGNSIQTIHLDIYDFEGSEIKRLTTYDDNVSVLVQMGAMPAPDSLELVPSFTLPDPEATGLSPLEAAENAMAVWNTHDLESYAKLIRPDADILLAPLGIPMDRDAFIASQELYFLAYSDIRQDAVRLKDMGDGWVLVEVIFTATNDGPYFGIPATGNSLDLRGAWLGRFDEDGLMTNASVYWDELTTMTQLGLFPPPVDTAEVNKAVIARDFEEVWNQGNLAVADEVVAPDVINHLPPNPDMVGVEAYKGMVTMYRAAFPDIQWIIEDIMAEGDMVGVRLTATGTHQGEFMDVPPTGVQMVGTMIALARVVDGKEVESWNYGDFLGVMQQLGAVTPGRPMPENYMWGDSSEVSGDPGTPEANKALVVDSIERVWNQGNLDAVDETFSPDFVCHSPVEVISPWVGTETTKAVVTAYLAAFPDLHVTNEAVIAEGDMVMVRWTTTATHGGEVMGIPPTGRQVVFTGNTIYRIADGMIVENWWAWDAMGLMQQITATPEGYDNVFFMSLEQGLNMIALPLEPSIPYTARSLAEEIGATVVIRYNRELGKFEGFTLAASGDGFVINGGEGYIVNVSEARVVAFVGAAWTNEPPVEMAPPAQTSSAWAFVVSGRVLDGDMMSASDGHYTTVVKNLRTGEIYEEAVDTSGYFAAAWADLNREAVIGAGDRVEVAVVDSNGGIVSGPFIHDITLDAIRDAVVSVHLKMGDIIPAESALLQNYPNPFNPETWIPYHLKETSPVVVKIYGATGQLIRTLDLGYRDAGIYASRSRSAYWDGKNESGEEVTSGMYFYGITAGDFSAIKKMVIAQ